MVRPDPYPIKLIDWSKNYLIAHSAYIVQSKIINLYNRPFFQKNIRSIFKNIFNSEKCFNAMNKNIYLKKKPKDINSLPFIKNFGSVIFTSRNLQYFRDSNSAWDWIYSLKKGDSDISEFDDFNDYSYQAFGYDLDLFDQRMYALFFEISSPINLKAMYKNKTMATGKIFLHIYPCGYLIIFIAIDLKKENLTDFTKLSKAIKETKPDIKNKEWNWESRVKNGTLDIIINKIEEKIYDSIYEKKPFSF